MTYLQRFRSSATNRWLQRVIRVFQFLSPVISLGLFSARLAKIHRLAYKGLTASNGAVEGILAAAVAYTLGVMILSFCLKQGGPKILHWIIMLLDLAFMGAFIAVAVLTRPHGGSSGPCRHSKLQPVIPKGQNCNLPWGTFILSIVSTFLHFLTAAFHEVKDHRHKHRDQYEDGRYPDGHAGDKERVDRY